MTGAYLLHFEGPYKHARHYLGWSEDILARFERHVRGNGSPLVKAAFAEGCAIRLVRVWPGATRDDERRLKRRKNSPRLCPVCRDRKVREPSV
jgi:predicted GIY-YIG superfamily endonuclease